MVVCLGNNNLFIVEGYEIRIVGNCANILHWTSLTEIDFLLKYENFNFVNMPVMIS